MKKKGYLGYLLLMIVLFLAFISGSNLLAVLREDAMRNYGSSPLYSVFIAISLLFPIMLGMLFSIEHLWLLRKKHKKFGYNFPRFFCMTVPLALLLLYHLLFYFHPIPDLHLPFPPTLYVKNSLGAILFFFGYTLLTNFIPSEKNEKTMQSAGLPAANEP